MSKLKSFKSASLLALCTASVFPLVAAAQTAPFQGQVPSSIEQSDRYALVIGNSAYDSLLSLDSPVHDVVAISDVLTQARFRVFSYVDLDRQELEQALQDFLRELSPEDTALVYYSGHAAEVLGRNYLLPTDAELTDPDMFELEAISISDYIQQISNRARVQLVFLDACRDLPFPQDSFSIGESVDTATEGGRIGEMEIGVGTLLSFGTQPGEVAYDGSTNLSPFTAALTNNLNVSGRDVSSALAHVRQAVMQETNGAQIPWEISMFVEDFYFTDVPVAFEPSLHQAWVPNQPGTVPLSVPNYAFGSGQDDASFQILSIIGDGALSIDGSAVQPGDTLSLAKFRRMDWQMTADLADGSQAAVTYLINDGTGTAATDVLTVNATNNPEVTDQIRALEASRSGEQATLAATSLFDEAASTIPIAVGPIPLFDVFDLSGLNGTLDSTTFAVVDPDPVLGLSVNGSLVLSGEPLSLEDVLAMTAEPSRALNAQAGQATTRLVNFAIDAPNAADQTFDVDLTPVQLECDRLASDRLDSQGAGGAGLFPNEVDPSTATAVCRSDVATFPNVPRLKYQLARALRAAGEHDEVIALLEAAHEDGHLRATEKLGSYRLSGRLLERDEALAERYLRQAMAGGDPFAFHALGRFFIRSDDEVKRAEGLDLLARAAEAGHTYAFNELGAYYNRGRFAEADPERARLFYEASAARKDIYGYHNLGVLYRRGRGVEQDLFKAADWFKRASDEGHPESGVQLGSMALNGELSGSEDINLAQQYYRESANRGSLSGNFQYGRFLLDREPSETAQIEAARRLGLAMALGNERQLERIFEEFSRIPDVQQRKSVQTLLVDVGEDIGDIDGVLGPSTRQAIANALGEDSAGLSVERVVAQLALKRYRLSNPRVDLF